MNRAGSNSLDFAHVFASMTGGRTPFKWQTRLFNEMVVGRVPEHCALPTGLGKTSVILIWLIALAELALRWDRSDPTTSLPRRLAFVVNRRTVVDQATDDARRILGRLYRSGERDDRLWASKESIERLGLADEPDLEDSTASSIALLRDALSRLTGDPSTSPLAISTLRGELADNGEWRRDPARPAIIIGTIDMIGSKLLFSGYGDGRYGRAHHAGLVGQDTLIVHDEAHLSPAFQALLSAVESEQRRSSEPRPIRLMSLSATTRAPSHRRGTTTTSFGLEREDEQEPLVQQRIRANKTLEVIGVDHPEVTAEIARQALRRGDVPSRILVYARTPDAVSEIAKAIIKALGKGGDARVAVLTGTIRGFERDALARGPILSEFRSAEERQALTESLFLISTSAGEVGADWDADHLICDLSALDSMAQRLGRVNRFGGKGRKSSVKVVIDNAEDATGTTTKKSEKKSAFEAALGKTAEILQRVVTAGGDVSPLALGQLMQRLTDDEKRAAFSPEPTVLHTTDILFDRWCLTSITGEMPGRPTVETHLHGAAEWEPPETHVAWRADLSLLAQAGGTSEDGTPQACSEADLDEVFEAFPLRSVELLRDRTDRVLKQLSEIAKRESQQRVVVIKYGKPR